MHIQEKTDGSGSVPRNSGATVARVAAAPTRNMIAPIRTSRSPARGVSSREPHRSALAVRGHEVGGVAGQGRPWHPVPPVPDRQRHRGVDKEHFRCAAHGVEYVARPRSRATSPCATSDVRGVRPASRPALRVARTGGALYRRPPWGACASAGVHGEPSGPHTHAGEDYHLSADLLNGAEVAADSGRGHAPRRPSADERLAADTRRDSGMRLEKVPEVGRGAQAGSGARRLRP